MNEKLNEVIAQEMTKMAARRVDYAPTDQKDIAIAIRIMQSDLAKLNLKDSDCDRVRATFDTIALQIGKWPTAYMVRDNLIKRHPRRMLANEPGSPQVASKFMEAFRAILRKEDPTEIINEAKRLGKQE